MKRPALLLALPLLALTCSDASLLARGGSRPEANGGRAIGEARSVCLDAPGDLPPCTFGAEAGGETRGESSRRRRDLSGSAGELDGEDASPSPGDEGAKPRAIVVYRIEGCVPSRLPFDLPICEEEDTEGRTVEVRRLFPFNVMGSSGYNSDTTFVFPEVDMDQWHRFVRPSARPADSEDGADRGDEVRREVSRAEESDAPTTKIPKRKKVGPEGVNGKKTLPRMLKKFDRRSGSRKIDGNDVFSESPSVEKLQPADDRPGDRDSSCETGSDRSDRMDETRREDGDIDRRAVDEASVARHTDEFPYAKAIPYDPEKLRVPRIDSEFPRGRATPYRTEKLRALRRGSAFSYSGGIIYERRSSRFNEIKEDEDRHGDTSRRDEFPRAEAVSHCPEELGVARVDGEFPYDRAVPYDPEKLRHPRRGIEFSYSGTVPQEPTSGPLNEMVEGTHDYASPYAKAISSDRKKFGTGKVDGEFPYDRAVPYDPAKLRHPRRGIEFSYSGTVPQEPTSGSLNEMVEGTHDYASPYAKAIPHDRKKFGAGKVDGEFPYDRAIPYDPSKLRIAARGVEFPYAKAIPYDRKKLEERWTEFFNGGSVPLNSWESKGAQVERKPSSSRGVPLDPRILDAAQGGRIFPYSRARPDDASKILEAMELAKSGETGRTKVPVRRVETLSNERVPTYASKLRIEQDGRRPEGVPGSSEVRKNIVNTGKDDYPYKNEDPLEARLARSATEPEASSDVSFDDDNLEIPRRWSEFPYSKAIPFDPSKLRRPRSTMEDYANSSVFVPQDFPYAKAIPYDRSKLTAFGRKKSESRDDRANSYESKFLERLERSARSIF